jgi:ribosomal protein S8
MSSKIHLLCHTLEQASHNHLRQIALKDSEKWRSIVDVLYQQGLIQSYATGDVHGPFHLGVQIPVTPTNKDLRRLWVDLKYRQGQPVLSKMRIVSSVSRRVFATREELCALAAARSPNVLLRTPKLGQVTIIETPFGILELKDAVSKKVGGEVLCYALTE